MEGGRGGAADVRSQALLITVRHLAPDTSAARERWWRSTWRQHDGKTKPCLVALLGQVNPMSVHPPSGNVTNLLVSQLAG